MKYLTGLFVLLSGAIAIALAAVTVSDNQSFGGASGFLKIQTDNATYYYHKTGATLAGMVDNGGKDWISWNTAAGAAGLWRGLPKPYAWGWNLESTSGVGATTTILSQSTDSAKIRTIKGTNEVTWTFYKTHAIMAVIQKAANYYFTYEGTPYGRFDGSKNYLVKGNATTKLYFSTNWSGDIGKATDETWEWVYIGDNDAADVLFLVHHQDDTFSDVFQGMSPMGVVAFGRGWPTTSLITGLDKFSIGFVQSTDKTVIAQAVKTAVSGTTTGIIQKTAKVTFQNELIQLKNSGSDVAVSIKRKGDYHVAIFDCKGACVAKATAVNGKAVLPAGNLVAGVYIVTVNGVGGGFSAKCALNR